MNLLLKKGLTVGMFIMLCCGLLGCGYPDRRLTGKWILNEYKDGLRTDERASSFLTINSEDEYVLDTPGRFLGIVEYRYTIEGPYKTDLSAKPSKITLHYDILGLDTTNVGLHKFSGPFWNRTLSLALNYEADQDAALRLSEDGGPVLVGQKDPDSKLSRQGVRFVKNVAQFMK